MRLRRWTGSKILAIAHKDEILQRIERLKKARELAIEEGDRQAVAEFNQAIAELQSRLRHLMEECGYADDEEPCEAHKHEILQQLERLENARKHAIEEGDREAVAEISQAIEELQARLERLAEECGYEDEEEPCENHKHEIFQQLERLKNARENAIEEGNRQAVAEFNQAIEELQSRLRHLMEECGYADDEDEEEPCEAHKHETLQRLERLKNALEQAKEEQNLELAERLIDEIEEMEARLHQLAEECGYDDDEDPCEVHKDEILQRLERLEKARQLAMEEGDRQAVAEFNQAIEELQIRLRHLMEECGYEDQDDEDPCEAHKHEILQRLERLENARQQAIKEENRDAVIEINQAIEELQTRLERLAEECGYEDEEEPCEAHKHEILQHLERLENALEQAKEEQNRELAERIIDEIEEMEARLHQLAEECGYDVEPDRDPCKDHKDDILQQLERLKKARENAMEEGDRQAVAEFNQAIEELQIRLRHLMEECGYNDDEPEQNPCEDEKSELLEQLRRLNIGLERAKEGQNQRAVEEFAQQIEEWEARWRHLLEECGYDSIDPNNLFDQEAPEKNTNPDSVDGRPNNDRTNTTEDTPPTRRRRGTNDNLNDDSADPMDGNSAE